MLSTSPASAVVITGGASGIGFASADALAEAGRPVAIWDLDQRRSEDVARDIADRRKVPTVGVGIDLSRLEGIADALERSRRTLPVIGGLVHSAGIANPVPLMQLTQASWEAVLNVNLRALPFLVQALLPDLRDNPGSAVVGIASINATLGNGMVPAYSASKGGMLSLVRALADTLSADGIRINAVSPGEILTPMIQPSIDALPPGTFERRILLGRLGAPDEVGRVVRFLLSDEASYVNAAEIIVDGGNISSQRG